MTQKEKLKQFLEDLKNDDKLLNDFIKRVDNDALEKDALEKSRNHNVDIGR